MFRMANFFVSSNLAKGLKMPDCRAWRVCGADNAVEGGLLLHIRSKGWLIDLVSKPMIRHCVLTKRGYLLIYTKPEKGFVLDMRAATELTTCSDVVKVQGKEYRRCRLKLRFRFGTVNIVLTNGKIDLWRDHLLNASAKPRTVALRTLQGSEVVSSSIPNPLDVCLRPIEKQADMVPRPPSSMYGPLEEAKNELRLATFNPSMSNMLPSSVEVRSPNKMARVTYSETMVEIPEEVDTSTCDDDYQWLANARSPTKVTVSPEMSTTDDSGLFSEHSVRESSIPVGWLRRQLEIRGQFSQRRTLLPVRPPQLPQTASFIEEQKSNGACSPLSEKNPFNDEARSNVASSPLDDSNPFKDNTATMRATGDAVVNLATAARSDSGIHSVLEEQPLKTNHTRTSVSKSARVLHTKSEHWNKVTNTATASAHLGGVKDLQPAGAFDTFQFWRTSLYNPHTL